MNSRLISNPRKSQDSDDGILNTAFYLMQNASRLWQLSTCEQRLRLQDALFPGGLEYTRKDGFRTSPKSKAFNIFELLNAPDSNVVAAEGLEPPTRGL